ncbi:hypothetical protein CTAYLR_006476 [Chrysophaeum taylorii]|uniref:Vacuolar protein sorting-associated protein 51 homolog n=1 Tax=Chrysophaeum taylorii TaxID=2483200 RepID=A0AAD7XP29_9STRA|nr:hypothetical protein CTAYLR_006476 [Chrysophaeum taylorii]
MKYDEEEEEDYDDEDDIGGEQPSRARELLANFYGKLGKSSEEEEAAKFLQSKEAAIDRADFNADDHVREMLETKKLQELLEADEALCRDVKTLSGDMQTLVYENYSKFISATDTIRDMQRNVSAMEDEMRSLTTTMADIDSMSTAVNSSLADKRAQIDKLVRARRLLKRLEFLFELPRKLSAAVAAKNYDEAVRYYTTTDEILRRYEHVPSLREIRRESSRIAGALRESLRASLDGEPSEVPEELAERVVLLVRLGASPAECERAAFASGFSHLSWLLRTAIAKARGGSLPLRVASIVSDVAPRFVSVADALNAVAERVGGAAKDEDDRPSLDVLALSLFSEYIDAVDELLTREIASADESEAERMADEAARALEIAGDCVETAAGKCGIGDALRLKLADLARRAAAGRLEASIRAAKRDALSRLAGLARETPAAEDLREACVATARQIVADARNALDRVSALSAGYLEDDDLSDATADLFAWVAGATEALGEVRTDATSGISDAPDSFRELCESWDVAPPERAADDPVRPLAVATVARELKACADDHPRVGASVDEARTDRAATALVSRFVRLSAARVVRSNDLLADLDDRPAAAPRAAVCEALAAVDAASDAIARAVGEAPVDPPVDLEPLALASSLAPPRPPSAPRVGGIELDVERLFARRESSSRPLDDDPDALWTRDAVATTLLRALARALIEGVRQTRALTRPQYDQLQLDARYLHSALERRVSGVDALRDLDRLVQDFLQEASERTLVPVHAPSPLDDDDD